MIDVVLFLVGSLIVLFTLYDVGSTAISLSSVRGPISTRACALVWRIGRRAQGTRLRVLQRGSGPLLLVLILVGWLLALTVGWSLIFSVDGALASTAEPGQQSSDVRWVDAAFFVFGGLIGRGSSGLEPNEVVWSSAVALMTLTGVGLITLSLAWILPVVNAVVHKGALAARLSALGGTPQEMVMRSWTGRDLGNLDLHLLPLVPELSTLAQQHLAFPVIHYFNSAVPRAGVAIRIAALDEALTLVEAAGLDEAERGTGLDRSTTEPLRQAISDYLATLELSFITSEADAPPPPVGDRLIAAGLAGRDLDVELSRICDELEPRRSLMHSYVLHSGSTWDDVARSDDALRHDPRHG